MSRSTFPLHRLFGVLTFCVLVTAQLVAPWQAAAEQFDWRYVEGTSFVTGVRNQGSVGTCWAFGATAALESKYSITRNFFGEDLSEQHLVCETDPEMGGIDGGYADFALTYFTTTGIVLEAELPYTEQDTSSHWPLQPGWESRVYRCSSIMNGLSDDPGRVKSALKAYGPLCVSIRKQDLDEHGVGTDGNNHAVLLVGYNDNPIWAGGGAYIIKNSWGEDSGNDGYNYLAYANLERHGQLVRAITGQAYRVSNYGTLTWIAPDGGGGSWTVTNESWRYDMDGNVYGWLNSWERSAVFDSPTDPNLPVYVGSNVSAYRLDIHSGATGYWFTGDERQLLVTGGGIRTQEDCTIDCKVALGMTQTWTVAAGKALTMSGNVKMHINSLTIGGDGDTTLNGTLEDVSCDPQFATYGLLTGYRPSLTKIGAGHLTLKGANTYGGETTVDGGTLTITGGGSVVDSSGYIGYYSGSTGQVAVDGNFSSWSNSETLIVGRSGSGTLTVQNGGSVSNTSAWLGYYNESSGTATVTGAGSTWTNEDNLFVGFDDDGVLTITGGGLVSVGGTLKIDADTDDDSFINMSSGGMLALVGDADDSLIQFLDLINGTDAIRYWDNDISNWADITGATYSDDYTLEYLTTGDLAGYTFLTVGAFLLAADFDGDGDVDGDDFLSWQAGFGTPSGAQKPDGDYDNDGDVDGDDFLGWQSQFGSGNGSASAAVPEPTSIAFVLVTAVMGMLWRHGRISRPSP